MRKLAIIGLAVMTAVALSAVAFAQTAPIIESTLEVSPSKSGSKSKPANGRLVNIFNVNPESESTLSRIEYLIPRNIKLSGKGFPTCSVDQINASGDEGCKKGSQVGTGAATALLGPNKAQLDFDVTVYVSGNKSLALYLKTSLFNIAIPADIVGQKVQFDIPERVQQPVGGLYSYVTSVTADLGKQPGIKATAKVKKTVKIKKTVKKNGKKRKKTVKVKRKVNVPFVSIVGCSAGRHEGSVTAFLANNPDAPPVPSISDDSEASCK